jgi:acetyl esterase/lipase
MTIGHGRRQLGGAALGLAAAGALPAPPAAAQAVPSGEWLIGPRRLPPPTHVPPALREAIAATPAPDPAAAMARVPTGIEGWRAAIGRQEAAAAELMAQFLARVPVRVEQAEAGGVRVFWVTPNQPAPEHREHLFVYVHGGAFIKGGGIGAAFEAMAMANRMGINAVAIDYRMPPDHLAPTAMEDIVAAWRAIAAARPGLRLAMGGTSAGANLTLVSTLRLKELGQALPRALFVGTPVIEFAKRTDSRWIMEGVDARLVIWDAEPAAALALYRGTMPEDHPHISPIHGDWSGFPPTILASGTRDMMLSDTVLAHRKLRRAGVVAELHVYEGHAHGDYVIAPDSAEHFAELKAFLLRHLG